MSPVRGADESLSFFDAGILGGSDHQSSQDILYRRAPASGKPTVGPSDDRRPPGRLFFVERSPKGENSGRFSAHSGSRQTHEPTRAIFNPA